MKIFGNRVHGITESWDLDDRVYIISSTRRGKWNASVRFGAGSTRNLDFRSFGYDKFTSRKEAIRRCERHLKNGR